MAARQRASDRWADAIGNVRMWLGADRWELRSEEKPQWLDEAFRDFWPRIAKFLERNLKDVVEPAINARLPDLIKGKVVFQEVSLGSTPPKFGPLSVLSTEDKRELEIRLGFCLDTEVCVTLALLGLQVGVSKLLIDGQISIVFRPYYERPPFFGGLEVFFINPPKIELSWHGAGRVANFPTVRQVVRGTLGDLIANRMVLPRRIAVDMNEEDDVDIADLRCRDPYWVLRLTVVRAQGLPVGDMNMFAKASSDPYVVVSLGSARHTSPAVLQSLDPVWDFTADYPVHDPAQLVSFRVYDQDNYSPDDFLATALDVRLEDVIASKDSEVELPLVKPWQAQGGSSPAGAGLLHVSGRFMELSNSSPGDGVFLAAKIHEVLGLHVGADRHPFKVQLLCAGICGSTNSSYGTNLRTLSGDAQAALEAMVEAGTSLEDAAKAFGCDKEDVIGALSDRKTKDDAMSKAKQNAMERRHAAAPQFEEVVQLLVPDPRLLSQPGAVMELVLLDKTGASVASARVDAARLMGSDGRSLEGPFELEGLAGARVRGGLRARLYSEVAAGA